MYLFISFLVIYTLWRCYVTVRMVLKRLSLSAIPQPPLDDMFKGHEPSVNKAKEQNRFLDLFVDWVELYGTNILFYIGNRPFIFTADPTMLKLVSTDLKNFTKVAALPNRSLFGQKIIGTSSILSGDGLHWAIKRRSLCQFFAKTNVEELFKVSKPHMEGCDLNRWKNLIQNGNTIELHEQLSITFCSYLQVLGLEKFLQPDDMADKVANILEAIPKPLFQRFSYMFSKDKTRMQKLIQKMRSDALKVSQERYEELTNNPNEPLPKVDLLGHLIEANKTIDGTTVNNPEEVMELVVDDVMTLCLVMDNMVKQLCSLFMLLEKNTEIQEKMFEELRTQPIDRLQDLNKLDYTEKCLLESLRMAPALLRGTRTYKTDKMRRFGPYVVNTPAVRIHFSEYVMQHNPQWWTNPKVFDPERWQPGFVPTAFSYMPFYTGSRGCLGKHMAMMMMKLTLAVLVKNFSISQNFDASKPPIMSQNMAVMRIINNVDIHMTPLKL